MASLREAREAILVGISNGVLDEVEGMLLFDINKSKNLDYPYWNYEKFDLDILTDEESWSEFRFFKNDIYRLKECFEIPEEIKTYNRLSIDGIEALCIFLKRFSYPNRYFDMIPRFGRPVPQLSIVSTHVLNHLYARFSPLLYNFNQPFMQPENLEEYCQSVARKGAALQNCFGFIDGTVRPICRPGTNQKIVYNGHKRVHALKFQSLVIPSGLIANMYGPIEGKRHDCKMLTMSGLLNDLTQYAWNRNHEPLCIYGDPAYPLRVHLQGPFKLANLTE